MQSRTGYQISVIKNGREVLYKDRIGKDPGEAAAQALTYQAQHGGRIVADKKVMDIVNGE